MQTDAIISDCGRYRYMLSRVWDDGGKLAAFIMLNPSTADASEDDPTIRRCKHFAEREGCGGLVVVNLFAYRATSPKDMKAAAEPIGDLNDHYVRTFVDLADGPVIAAWGNHGAHMKQGERMADLYKGRLKCFRITKTGHPEHPLYQKNDAGLIDYA